MIKIFAQSKLKKREEEVSNGKRFYLDYNNVKGSDELKLNLFRKIFKDNYFLVVIETDMVYDILGKKDSTKMVQELRNFCDNVNVQYNVIAFEKPGVKKFFGFSIGKPDKDRPVKHYKFCIVMKYDELEKIKGIVKKYNTHYYVKHDIKDSDELYEIYESNYDRYEKLDKLFDISIFDSDYIKRIGIFADKECSSDVETIVNSIF